VPRNQFRRRLAQAARVDVGAVEFHVEMRGDATELLIIVAAQPHRVLHGGQRKSTIVVVKVCRVGFGGFLAAGVLRDERRPRGDRRVLRQGGEVDRDPLFTPAT
jgi:hypothetical protein